MTTMKSKIITLLINIVVAIVFSGSSCSEPNDKDVMLLNNSHESVYIYYTINRNYNDEVDVKYFYNNEILHPTPPKSKYWICRIGELDENKDELVLHIITFKKATIDEYGWTRIVDENIYDEYLKYSYKELEAMNFRIVYGGYRN